MAKIKNIYASEILDSRGNPTIETTVELSDGASAKSSAPSGASVGTYESVELRDDDKGRFGGLGVLKAMNNVNNVLGPKLLGLEVFDQQRIDRVMIEMDGTMNKARLGANAILSISQAVAKAGAASSLLPLFMYLKQFLPSSPKKGATGARSMPTPLFNMIEGGVHASNNLNFQEFIIVPASSKGYKECLELGVSVYQRLRELLHEVGLHTLVADEAGFAPNLSTNQEAFHMLRQAIEKAAYKFGLDAFLGVDAAANSLHINNSYKLSDRATPFNVDDFVEFYKTLFSEYSLIYIEDPFSEDDWDGWKKIYQALSQSAMIIGDDLTTTNPYRLQLAINNNAINGIIVKPNQIGTVTEAIAVCGMAKFKNLKIVVSHRSGETADSFIADFAVAVGADYVKFGAPARERTIKYNRLLEIETESQKI